MQTGRNLLSQIVTYIPKYRFDKLVDKYRGNYKAQVFSCWEQYVCMVFAQLTYRESLRDIESCLEAYGSKLYHCGIKSVVSKSTLAYWNEKTDWKLYGEYASYLIEHARKLYSSDNDFLNELDATVYAFDSTTIDLCLSLFPWAKFRRSKAAIKAHTLIDLQGNIPAWIFLTEGSVHDVKALDQLPLESGAFYVMDKGYVDFTRLFRIHSESAIWITRAKDNMKYKRQYPARADKENGVMCDQTIILTGFYSNRNYPDKIRRIKFKDVETKITYEFITNNFKQEALVICKLYKQRWQVELFFKWIKQNLRIKSFYGTSKNAVYTQIWIAVSVYVLIAIIKKEIQSPYSLNKILQILSVGVFEKMPINQAFTQIELLESKADSLKQLNLFDSYLDSSECYSRINAKEYSDRR
jgi:hypothetical protein